MRGIAWMAGTVRFPRYAKAAIPQMNGNIARPRKRKPVQVKMLLETFGLSEEKVRAATGAQAVKLANQARVCQKIYCHPKAGWAKGSNPA